MATHSIFLPGRSHGQRSLAGYSLWGHKELDMTEWLTHTYRLKKIQQHKSGEWWNRALYDIDIETNFSLLV